MHVNTIACHVQTMETEQDHNTTSPLFPIQVIQLTLELLILGNTSSNDLTFCKDDQDAVVQGKSCPFMIRQQS